MAITWAVLFAAPFFRYLFGTLLLDTGGSGLAVAILPVSSTAPSCWAPSPASGRSSSP